MGSSMGGPAIHGKQEEQQYEGGDQRVGDHPAATEDHDAGDTDPHGEEAREGRVEVPRRVVGLRVRPVLAQLHQPLPADGQGGVDGDGSGEDE